ncbi:hypothetical protein HPP92_021090 [Vanilla planifolia]|nr:hypothetical protein HPP92_021090 [Vanilla planifolia]
MAEEGAALVKAGLAEEKGLEREGEVAAEELPEEGEIEDEESLEDSSESKKGGLASMLPHPLEHSWTFWYDNASGKSKQIAWGSSIRLIHTFNTVEDFWSLYNNIHHPSKLVNGADLYCFKHKIEPKWEDPVCANGGKWTITMTSRGKSDTIWLYTLLAMIGEQFDYGDEICGAVVNVRSRQEKVSIWTKNAFNEAAQISIGKQWKELVDYKEQIGFITHDDSMKLDKGAKIKYAV